MLLSAAERRTDVLHEPSAVARNAAAILADLYWALRERGFEDVQALAVVAACAQGMIHDA